MVEKQKPRFEVQQIATQVEPVFIDNEAEEENKRVDLHNLLAEIANDIKNIKRVLSK